MNFLITMLPPLMLISCLYIKHKNARHSFGSVLLALYFLFTLYYITDISTIQDILHASSIGPITLIPFSSEGVSTYLLNVILFMPLGFLLPVLYDDMENIWLVLLVGFCFSFCIETLQLFNARITDIDDLITNTSGTFLGYIGGMLTAKRCGVSRDRYSGEAVLIMLCSVISVILLKR